jgi:hypothetical protein
MFNLWKNERVTLTEQVATSVDEGEDQGDLGDDEGLQGESLKEKDGDGQQQQLDQGEDGEEGEQLLELELASGCKVKRL